MWNRKQELEVKILIMSQRAKVIKKQRQRNENEI